MRCEYRAVTRASSGRVSVHRCRKLVADWAARRIGELGGAYCHKHALERVR